MTLSATTFPPHIQVIIPAYHATQELEHFLPTLLKRVPPSAILIIIDGKDEATEELCNKNYIQAITHEKNQGKGAALTTGFQNLKKDTEWAFTLDADGQHSPEDIPLFLSTIQKSSKEIALILGARKRTLTTMPPARIISNTLTSWVLSLFTGQKIHDSQCGFRAYHRSIFETTKCAYKHFEMESEILLRTAAKKRKIVSLPIQTIYGTETSNISHFKDTLRWIKAVILTKLMLLRGEA